MKHGALSIQASLLHVARRENGVENGGRSEPPPFSYTKIKENVMAHPTINDQALTEILFEVFRNHGYEGATIAQWMNGRRF